MAEKRDKPNQEWLLERQHSMIGRAAKEGLSNLVQIALQLQPVDKRQVLAPTREGKEVPLITACFNGHLEVVKDLLEVHQVPLDCTGPIVADGRLCKQATPLWCAAGSGNIDLVKYLVEKGADIDKGPETKSTPLRAAVFMTDLPIVQFLVQNGADVNSTNERGHSVLMNACCNTEEHSKLVRFLLESGADVNYAVPHRDDITCSGWTALHQCAWGGSVGVAKLLLRHGAVINRDSYGNTPLMMAAYQGHAELVEFLIETSDCSRDDKADALELLGASCVLKTEADTARCLSLWTRAMEERYLPGRPKASKQITEKKVAAYQNAVEVQTLTELRRLQATQDVGQIRMQALLVFERVLGPSHDQTLYGIKYIAATYADDDQLDRAIELLYHAALRVSDTPLFSEAKLKLFAFVISILRSHFPEDGRGDACNLNFSDAAKFLQLILEEMQSFRGGGTVHKVANPEDIHVMMKILLQLVLMTMKTVGQHSQRDKQWLSETLKSLVQLKLRGRDGLTLLHLACTADVSNLYDNFTGCTFPAPEVVRGLLDAGSDVNALSKDGKTALQIAKAESEGRETEVTKILVRFGAR